MLITNQYIQWSFNTYYNTKLVDSCLIKEPIKPSQVVIMRMLYFIINLRNTRFEIKPVDYKLILFSFYLPYIVNQLELSNWKKVAIVSFNLLIQLFYYIDNLLRKFCILPILIFFIYSKTISVNDPFGTKEFFSILIIRDSFNIKSSFDFNKNIFS